MKNDFEIILDAILDSHLPLGDNDLTFTTMGNLTEFSTTIIRTRFQTLEILLSSIAFRMDQRVGLPEIPTSPCLPLTFLENSLVTRCQPRNHHAMLLYLESLTLPRGNPLNPSRRENNRKLWEQFVATQFIAQSSPRALDIGRRVLDKYFDTLKLFSSHKKGHDYAQYFRHATSSLTDHA